MLNSFDNMDFVCSYATAVLIFFVSASVLINGHFVLYLNKKLYW